MDDQEPRGDAEAKPILDQQPSAGASYEQAQEPDGRHGLSQLGRAETGVSCSAPGPDRKATRKRRQAETHQSPDEDTTGFLFCVKCGTPAGEYTGSELYPRCKAGEDMPD
jgi:hypothetical protein